MRASGKVAAGAGSVFALLVAVLFATPFLFRDRIEARVQEKINESVAARVEWGGLRLSLLRSFPNLTLRLDDLAVTGVERFEGETLASIGRFDLVLDIGSVLRGLRGDDAIVVRAIGLHRPSLHLRVLEDGTANWDIARETPSTGDEEPADFAITLRRLEVRDGVIGLDDHSTGLLASLEGLRQSLSGDFRHDSFLLRTRATADAVSLRLAGIPYLSRARLDLQADLDADMAARRFTFRENRLQINDLLLTFAGNLGISGDDLDLDLEFGAPRTDFRHILSLVPAIYARDFETLQTTGAMAASGRVHGRFGGGEVPAFSLRATIDDGTFRYPDLPLPASDIFLDLSIDNAGGGVDATVVKLDRFHAVLGGEPIDAFLTLRTPVSDPDFDVRVAGRIDLADLARTVKLAGVDRLTGLVVTDLSASGRMSAIDGGDFDRIVAHGGAEFRDVGLSGPDLPHAVEIDEARIELSPRHAEVHTFAGRIGGSDVRMAGFVDNPLGFAFRDEVLRGRMNLTGTRFDLDEWRSDSPGLTVVPIPANLDFELRAVYERLTFGLLEVSNLRGDLTVRDRRLMVDDVAMNLLGGEVTASGFYETTEVTRPTFEGRLRLAGIDIPDAYSALSTVRVLAPIARYAEGTFSTELSLRGALGSDLTPHYEMLNGQGMLETSRLVLQDFPAMDALAGLVRIDALRNPVFEGIRSAMEIRDGRLHVRPFDVEAGAMRMNVSGSSGIDQSLEYTLRLHLPRSVLGTEATRAVSSLVSQAGRTGFDVATADVVEVGFLLTGTVTDPSLRPDLSGAVSSVRDEVEQALRDEIASRVDGLGLPTDEAVDEARLRADAEFERLLREAEQRATTMREEAARLAESVRREGDVQANALLDRAANPLARTAARPAADRLRREADERAEQIIREADRRADAVIAEVHRREREPDGPDR